jgi:membrane associated rhomboid family serine protease
MIVPVSTEPEAAPRDRRVAGLQLVGLLLAIMWVTELVNVIDDDKLEQHGIRPRETDGLDGVVFAPFLHADWGHLIGNTVPFILFGGVIALAGPMRVAAVTAIGMFISGMGTWLTGPENSLHIGASGVVFAFGTYLIPVL